MICYEVQLAVCSGYIQIMLCELMLWKMAGAFLTPSSMTLNSKYPPSGVLNAVFDFDSLAICKYHGALEISERSMKDDWESFEKVVEVRLHDYREVLI